MIEVPDVDAVDAGVAGRFHAEGYLTVERLVDDPVVDQLREAYDEIISGQVTARGDRLLGDVIRQVKHPSKDHPRFQWNPAVDAGVELARRLFGREDVTKIYEMLIDKPAGTPHPTPWHQDVAYWGKPVAAPGTRTTVDDIQVWLALDEVDADNGGMQFLPRAHGAPSLRHCVASGDPDDEGRLLAIDEPLDVSRAEAASLRPGGCTVHLVGTPHHTGPNLTARSRRAYIFNIGPAEVAVSAERSLRTAWGSSARLGP